MSTQLSASARIDAPPDAVLALLTDASRLAEWNRAITDVVEAPTRLEAGSEWKVRLHALGQTWVSRSQVSVLDPAAGRFSYRSQSDDGNPSFADWEWRVEPSPGGSIVSVSVDLNPVTFWRKHLLVKIRRPALRKELENSLAALGEVLSG